MSKANIERLAIAAYERPVRPDGWPTQQDWSAIREDEREAVREGVRRVLKAIAAPPTEEMWKAADAVYWDSHGFGWMWTAAILSLLSE